MEKLTKVTNLLQLDKEKIIEIYSDALLNSYKHICQIFSKEKGFNRDKTDLSFNEIVDKILNDKKYKHLTILHRKVINENFDLPHYEFGMDSTDYYLSICVSENLSEQLFKKHSLTLI